MSLGKAPTSLGLRPLFFLFLFLVLTSDSLSNFINLLSWLIYLLAFVPVHVLLTETRSSYDHVTTGSVPG